MNLSEISPELVDRVARKMMGAGLRQDDTPGRFEQVAMSLLDDEELTALMHVRYQHSMTEDLAKQLATSPRRATALVGARVWFEETVTAEDHLKMLLHAQTFGTAVWLWSYKHRLGDHAASAVTNIFLGEKRDLLSRPDAVRYMGLGRWVDGACTTLMVGHKQFSSLAMTSIGPTTYEDIHLPWPAFAVRVPDGLLATDEAQCTVIRFAYLRGAIKQATREDFEGTEGGRRIGRFVGTAERAAELEETDVAHVTLEMSNHSLLHSFRIGPHALTDVLYTEELEDESFSTQEVRAIRAARRVLIGLLYSMQYTDNWRERIAKSPKGKQLLRDGPPDHRTIMFGAPIRVDTRDALKQWIRHGGGKNAPPSVQSLVRGHYKRQVIGVGRTGRKVIWIEPFWRGPEDAPILAHPYQIGTMSTNPSTPSKTT